MLQGVLRNPQLWKNRGSAGRQVEAASIRQAVANLFFADPGSEEYPCHVWGRRERVATV